MLFSSRITHSFCVAQAWLTFDRGVWIVVRVICAHILYEHVRAGGQERTTNKRQLKYPFHNHMACPTTRPVLSIFKYYWIKSVHFIINRKAFKKLSESLERVFKASYWLFKTLYLHV